MIFGDAHEPCVGFCESLAGLNLFATSKLAQADGRQHLVGLISVGRECGHIRMGSIAMSNYSR